MQRDNFGVKQNENNAQLDQLDKRNAKHGSLVVGVNELDDSEGDND